MQITTFAVPMGIILLMLLIGFVVGVGMTVLLYQIRRPAKSDLPTPSAVQRDSSNPYEPSTVGLRAPNTNGCAIAFAVLLVAAVTAIAFAATFFAAARVTKSVPAPMPPPPTNLQPQLAPASETATQRK